MKRSEQASSEARSVLMVELVYEAAGLAEFHPGEAKVAVPPFSEGLFKRRLEFGR